MRLKKPLTRLERGTLVVSVKDRQGNVSRIERTFSFAAAGVAKPGKEDQGASSR
jgi:hypothetical protein